MAELKRATPSDIDLLRHAGIRTFGELADREIDHLHSHLENVIDMKKLSVTLPEKEILSKWKSQAMSELPGDIIMGPLPGNHNMGPKVPSKKKIIHRRKTGDRKKTRGN